MCHFAHSGGQNGTGLFFNSKAHKYMFLFSCRVPRSLHGPSFCKNSTGTIVLYFLTFCTVLYSICKQSHHRRPQKKLLFLFLIRIPGELF